MSWRKLTWRNGSRVAGSDRWTSMNGRAIASRASRSDDARVGQAAGVDDRDVEVALRAAGRSARPRGSTGRSRPRGRARRARRAIAGVDLVERLPAVDLGLAGAEQVEVRALEHEHAGHRSRRPRAPRGSSRPATTAVDDRLVGHVRRGRRRRRPSAGPSAAARRRASCRCRWRRGRASAESGEAADARARDGRGAPRSGRPAPPASRRRPGRSGRPPAGRRRPPRRGAASRTRRPPRRRGRWSGPG